MKTAQQRSQGMSRQTSIAHNGGVVSNQGDVVKGAATGQPQQIQVQQQQEQQQKINQMQQEAMVK